MRVIVSGSRDWTDEEPIVERLGNQLRHGEFVLCHGACPTGADDIADRWARMVGIQIDRFPADWDEYGRLAGPIRNGQMAEEGADLCLAFCLNDSRGTTNMITHAKRHRIPTEALHRWTFDD